MLNILSLGRPYFEILFSTPRHGIVVEPFSIRDSAADYPIFLIFKHSQLSIFHLFVVV